MKIEDLQKIAMGLPGVAQDIKWQGHLCFNIGGKMFLVTSPDALPSPVHSKSLKIFFMGVDSN
ncbi:MAG: MmcQ/YjbR family DNA-binding protein [Ignavibacteria bacterium]